MTRHAFSGLNLLYLDSIGTGSVACGSKRQAQQGLQLKLK
jgi:hypothetical protein